MTNLVNWFRKQRTQLLNPVGKFLVKLKIRASYVTFLAFILGLASVYFLFLNNVYFIVLGILHLVVDGLDGVVARANNSATKLGAHLDNTSDRLIVVLVLIKSYFYFNDYFLLIILALYVLHHLIFILSGLEGSVVYSRLGIFAFYFFGFYIGGYFLVGILSLYGLAQQFNSWLKKVTT